MLRSIPTMPPTKALMITSRLNCCQFARSPSWMDKCFEEVLGDGTAITSCFSLRNDSSGGPHPARSAAFQRKLCAYHALLSHFNRESTSAPVRNSLFQPTCLIAMCSQERDGFVGKHTIGATAVGYDFFVGRQFLQAGFQFCNRHGEGLGQVSRTVLLDGPNI